MHFISYYGIYWTNLLTRCHSASFCSLCLFIAEKAQKPKCSEKSRKITEILFRQKTHGARRARPEEAQGLHTTSRRGQEGGRPTLWCGPLRTPPTPPLHLYNPSRRKNPTPIDETPERLQGRRRHRETPFRGTEVSVPARRRDGGIAPGVISIDTTAIFIAIAVSYDEEGVVLPSRLRALPVAMWFISLSHCVIFM